MWGMEKLAETVKGWYHSWTHATKPQEIKQYSYDTMRSLYQQVAVVPKTVVAALSPGATRQLVKDIVWITYHDVLPMVLVLSVNQFIQKEIKNIENHSTDDLFSVGSGWLFTAGVSVITLAKNIYLLRKSIEFQTHVIVLSIAAPSELNKDQVHMDICNQCTSMRFAQGVGRDLVGFYATELALYATRSLPILGAPAAGILGTYHRGRYLLTLVLPELCNRHQMDYLNTHSALAWGIGIAFYAESYFINALLEWMSGIPALYYSAELTQLLFFIHLILVRNLSLPQSISGQFSLWDPIELFQRAIGGVFDIFCLGAKEQIKRSLKGPAKEDALKKFLQSPWMHHIFKSKFLLQTPMVANTIAAPLFHSYKNWQDDFIISQRWTRGISSAVMALQEFEHIVDSLLVRTVVTIGNTGKAIRKVTAKTLANMFHIPESLAELVLVLLGNQEAIQSIQRSKQKLLELLPQNERELLVLKKSYRDSGIQQAVPCDICFFPASSKSSSMRSSEDVIISSAVDGDSSQQESTHILEDEWFNIDGNKNAEDGDEWVGVDAAPGVPRHRHQRK